MVEREDVVANGPQDIVDVTLASGIRMPIIGLGVYRSGPDETLEAVTWALGCGYRLIDTAAAYGNERQVGEAIARSDVARDEIFVTTKMWISEYGYDKGLTACERSLRKLGLETLDLYLLHQPMPAEWERTIAAWKAAGRLLDEGRTRAIGVSNFNAAQISELIQRTGYTPHVNQVELHPFFTRRKLRAEHKRFGIVTQAWSPIGGVMQYMGDEAAAAASPLSHPVVLALAEKYGQTPAQVILRWEIQNDVVVIPKSVRRSRIEENFQIQTFALDAYDMAAIDALDTGVRSGPDPSLIDTKRYPLVIGE